MEIKMSLKITQRKPVLLEACNCGNSEPVEGNCPTPNLHLYYFYYYPVFQANCSLQPL